MSGQVPGHFTREACITLGMNLIHMNKQYQLLEGHYLHLNKQVMNKQVLHNSFVFIVLIPVVFSSLWYFGMFVTGPTSFAPIIEMAITIFEQSRGQYHVLV